MIKAKWRWLSSGVLGLVLLCVARANSQSTVQLAPADLVKAVVLHELKGPNASDAHWKYLLYKEVDGKVETREVVEAKSGTVDRLIAVSRRPLTDAGQRAEADRLFHFSHDVQKQQKLEEARRKDSERCSAFLKVIPEAFVFQYAGEAGGQVKVAFKPNPQYRPTSSEGRVLHEMAGEVWIDARQQRLISIDGELTNEVKFGGGLFGHLEKGGHFTVKRTESDTPRIAGGLMSWAASKAVGLSG